MPGVGHRTASVSILLKLKGLEWSCRILLWPEMCLCVSMAPHHGLKSHFPEQQV